MGKRDNTVNSNSRGHSINGRARKAERRAAAFARYEATKHLTVKQKLDRINGVIPDGANRQRARYMKILAKQEQTPEKPKAEKKVKNESSRQRRDNSETQNV